MSSIVSKIDKSKPWQLVAEWENKDTIQVTQKYTKLLLRVISRETGSYLDISQHDVSKFPPEIDVTPSFCSICQVAVINVTAQWKSKLGPYTFSDNGTQMEISMRFQCSSSNHFQQQSIGMEISLRVQDIGILSTKMSNIKIISKKRKDAQKDMVLIDTKAPRITSLPNISPPQPQPQLPTTPATTLPEMVAASVLGSLIEKNPPPLPIQDDSLRLPPILTDRPLSSNEEMNALIAEKDRRIVELQQQNQYLMVQFERLKQLSECPSGAVESLVTSVAKELSRLRNDNRYLMLENNAFRQKLLSIPPLHAQSAQIAQIVQNSQPVQTAQSIDRRV